MKKKKKVEEPVSQEQYYDNGVYQDGSYQENPYQDGGYQDNYYQNNGYQDAGYNDQYYNGYVNNGYAGDYYAQGDNAYYGGGQDVHPLDASSLVQMDAEHIDPNVIRIVPGRDGVPYNITQKGIDNLTRLERLRRNGVIS